jgi:predicted MPP superfamily phosphohydrolase
MTKRKFTIVSLLLTFGLWAFWLEPASLRNEDHNLNLPSWPSECNGLRIAVLADLHVGSPFNGIAKLERIVTLTLAAKPDLVLLAGDYVIHGVLGGKFTPPEDAARVLARLAAPMGIYAVLGNHDWLLDADRIINALESAGIHVLDDTSTVLQQDKCRFWLVGISDLWEGAHDIEAALRNVPESAPAIALTHNPDIFPEIPSRVTLTLAGHTHGGQVYIPGVGRPILPSRYRQRYAAGHIVEEDRHLFVSSGLGTSILPVRFLVPPEVSVLHLYKTESRPLAN